MGSSGGPLTIINTPPPPTLQSYSSSPSTLPPPYTFPPPPPYHSPGPRMHTPKRRTTSTSTTSTTFSNAHNSTMSYPRNPQQNAYVATLRRQKATVWCDRAQLEDPRLLAQQKQARRKAAMEVLGPPTTGSHGLASASSSTTSIRAGKFRHSSHVMPMASGSLVAGLPQRLSATEANDDSSDEEDMYMSGPGHHRRSGSGRSSLNSNHRKTNRPPSLTGSTSLQRQGSKGSDSSYYSPMDSTAATTGGELGGVRGKRSPPQLVSPLILEERTPEQKQAAGYFDEQKIAAVEGVDTVGPLPPTMQTVPQRVGLKRMGSVDEREARTMTMSGLRLVVANPD
ncbi:hypothetical protein EX30DRAFT_374820 [Ascodesmis nigricans]|uniref:Uncharacterized protein n=1 Tax=Ascodesmis nigricans TaxID=341454 RepID=A0A4S2MJV4_9PEZI|nr:hypothetical protein EX30DRAFT_374820 [Ascodesmis nigricans]